MTNSFFYLSSPDFSRPSPSLWASFCSPNFHSPASKTEQTSQPSLSSLSSSSSLSLQGSALLCCICFFIFFFPFLRYMTEPMTPAPADHFPLETQLCSITSCRHSVLLGSDLSFEYGVSLLQIIL